MSEEAVRHVVEMTPQSGEARLSTSIDRRSLTSPSTPPTTPARTPRRGGATLHAGVGGAKKAGKPKELGKKDYEKELRRLQVEMLQLEEWVRHKGLRVVVVFEGRDTAGKGGVIKRMRALLNPRSCRVVALPAPSERERTQWYFQRYA